jgi:hypothetical protein
MRSVGCTALCHRAKQLCDCVKVEVCAVRQNFAASDPETAGELVAAV